MNGAVNIIYVGGTVHRLAPFLDSLLRRTAWTFRLVLNGCDGREESLMARFAGDHPDRLEIRVIAADRVLPHGVVLELLLAEETGEFFSFLDSDIFAVDRPSLAEFLPQRDQVATCGCLPLWHRPTDLVLPRDHRVVGGRFLTTDDGQFLGCTYAAAYRTAALRTTLHDWGVSLRRYEWAELPPAVQRELDRRGLRRRIYDTAKVANVLLHTPDRPMVAVDMPGLVHVGAQSGVAAIGGYRRRGWRLAFEHAPWLIHARLRSQGIGGPERRSIFELERRRRAAVALLDSLITSGGTAAEAPEWIADPGVYEELRALVAPRGTRAAT